MTYSVLSSDARLGIAAETSDAVYAVPAFTVPFASGTRYRSAITQLYDRTRRGIDADLQDIQQGPYWSDWSVTTGAYPDWAGWLFRAMVGPDTFTAGTVTTFAASSAAGAASVSLHAAPPANSVLMLGTGASLEYAQAGTPTGSGPYSVPITTPSAGLRFAHAVNDPAQSQARHVFRQARTNATLWPSFSLTTDDGVDQLGWPGCCLGRVRLQVQDTGYAGLASDWSGFPPVMPAAYPGNYAVPGVMWPGSIWPGEPVTAASFTGNESAAQPFAGWSWGITTAGGSSTRGVSLDLDLSRVLQITPCCNGQQAPYGIFPGPMRASGSYKAIYDTPADLQLYRAAIQEPAVWTLTQPVLTGGASIAVTLSLSGWTEGAVSLEETYVSASYRLSGIANTADSPSSGVASVSLTNFVQSAYGP